MNDGNLRTWHQIFNKVPMVMSSCVTILQISVPVSTSAPFLHDKTF